MFKLRAKYIFTVCIFLICGFHAAFARTLTNGQFIQPIAGQAGLTETAHSDSEKASAYHYSVDPTKNTTIENAVLEVEELEEEEDSSFRKYPADPQLFAPIAFDFRGETVFHYDHNIHFVHRDQLYPTLDRYILLEVFRI